MFTLRRFLSRRWLLAFLGVAALLFGLAMLHPYPRQSLFGPTIRGKPWCVWEEEIRRQADPDRTPWFYRVLEKIGLINERDRDDLRHPELLPVFLYLADDGDANVRLMVAAELESRLKDLERRKELDDAILPVLRRLVQDDDPTCRMRAAFALWRHTKDIELKAVALSLSEHTDVYIREHAIMMLCQMARSAPDVFDPLSKLAAGDTNPYLRSRAVQCMQHFGKRGLPVLQRAFHDPHKDVRMHAFRLAGELQKDAEPLIPTLQGLRNDPDPQVRRDVARALHRIDPKQFPEID